MTALLFCSLSFPGAACAEGALETSQIINEQFERLNIGELESFIKKIDQDLNSQLSGFSLQGLLERIRSGRLDFNLTNVIKTLLDFLFRQLLTHLSLLGELLVLGTALALLEQLQSAFEQNTVARLAHGIGVLCLLTVALSSFTLALNTGREAIGNMVGLMHSILPVLLTLMAGMGNLTTVALIHPVVFVSLNIFGALTRNIVFPLIFCAAILGIINHISERFQVSRLADLLRDGSVILTTLFLTLFVGILGVQGVAGAVSDGIGLRTAKFLTGAFVPVVGGVLSDAVEAIMGCSLFLKNAVGILGTLIIFFMCALPGIKILSVAAIYRLAAALMEPLGAHRLGGSLTLLGNYLFVVFAGVAAVGLMFFIALTIVVGVGNFSVLLR
ncbi:MAG: stage III sporulation protein AE [Thermacetogeniaceae bacterium]